MINIRKLVSADRSIVNDILVTTDMFTVAEVEIAMELIDTYLTNKEQKDYMIYVAEDDDKQVIGYVCYGATPLTVGTYDLYWIAVSSKIQNKGIGKKLLLFVEADVKRQNGRLIIIETSSPKKYEATQQFYLHNQYDLEARIKDFYKPGDDKLIFTKKLTH
jgi:ribosomal protein S18 acetylase RimI-like enzyme